MPRAINLSLALAESSPAAPDAVLGLLLLVYRVSEAVLWELHSQQAHGHRQW